jgi:hypothetical protein
VGGARLERTRVACQKSLDARQMNEWIIHRLTPVEIAKLAAE